MKTFLSIAFALSALCGLARDTNRYDRVEKRPDGVTFSQRGGMSPSNYVATAVSYSDLFEDVRTNDTTYAADRFKEAVKKYAEKTVQDFDATKLENLSAFFDNLRTNKLASATHSFSNAVVTFSPPVPAQDFDAAKLTNNAAYFDNLRTNLVEADTLSFSNAVLSFETKQDFDARRLEHQSDFFDDARTGKVASVTHSLSNAVVTFSPPVDPSSLDARLLSNKDLMFDDIRTNRSPSVSLSFSNAVASVAAPPPDFDATKLTNKDAFFDDLRTNREAVASSAFGSAVRSKQAPASEITDSTNAVISADGSVYRLVKIPEVTNEYFTVESVNLTVARPSSAATTNLNNLRQSVGKSLYLTNSTYYAPYYEDPGYSSSGRSLCGLAFYRRYGGANGRWITVNNYASTWGYTAISVNYPFPSLSDGDLLSVTNGSYAAYQASYGNLVVAYRYHFEITPAYYSRQYVGHLVNDSDLSSSAVLTNSTLKTVGGTSVTQSHIGKGAGSFTTISADTSIKKGNQDVVYSVTVGGTTSRGDVTIDLDTPITTKLNAYKELHWDPGLSVTWTNVYNNGHVYMVTVTNTNVSVAP